MLFMYNVRPSTSSHVYRNDVIQFQFTMQFSMNCFWCFFFAPIRSNDGYGFWHEFRRIGGDLIRFFYEFCNVSILKNKLKSFSSLFRWSPTYFTFDQYLENHRIKQTQCKWFRFNGANSVGGRFQFSLLYWNSFVVGLFGNRWNCNRKLANQSKQSFECRKTEGKKSIARRIWFDFGSILGRKRWWWWWWWKMERL